MAKRFRTAKKGIWILGVLLLFFGIFLGIAGRQLNGSSQAANYEIIDDEGNPVTGTYELRRATATFGLSDYAAGDKCEWTSANEDILTVEPATANQRRVSVSEYG